MGFVDNTVDNVHRFFRLVDGRYWMQVESFYKYRDPAKTPHQHFEFYRNSLETIKNSTLVATKLKTHAGKLLERLLYDEFITTFTGLLGRHEEKSAQSSVRGLYLGVASALSAKQSGFKGNQGKATWIRETLPIIGSAAMPVLTIDLFLCLGSSSSLLAMSSTALSSTLTSTSASSGKNITKRKPPTMESARKAPRSDYIATKRIKEPWHSLIEVALLRVGSNWHRQHALVY